MLVDSLYTLYITDIYKQRLQWLPIRHLYNRYMIIEYKNSIILIKQYINNTWLVMAYSGYDLQTAILRFKTLILKQ